MEDADAGTDGKRDAARVRRAPFVLRNVHHRPAGCSAVYPLPGLLSPSRCRRSREMSHCCGRLATLLTA